MITKNSKANTIIFHFLLITVTFFYGILIITPALLLPKKIFIRVSKPLSNIILWLLKFTCSVTYEIKGLEKLHNVNNFIIASQHESPLETIILCSMFDYPVFILKKELLLIPFIGWALGKAETIGINRNQRHNAIRKIILQSKKLIKQNATIIIFPQGTRRNINNKIQPGVFALYKNLNVKIFPVILNTANVWEKEIFSTKTSGNATINILDAIPDEYTKEEFMEKLKSIFTANGDN